MLNIGESCIKNSECSSGYCRIGECAEPLIGDPCSPGSCASGLVCNDSTNRCRIIAEGAFEHTGSCKDFSWDCRSDEYCDDRQKVCKSRISMIGESCKFDYECADGFTCQDGHVAQSCHVDSDCFSGYACSGIGICVLGGGSGDGSTGSTLNSWMARNWVYLAVASGLLILIIAIIIAAKCLLQKRSGKEEVPADQQPQAPRQVVHSHIQHVSPEVYSQPVQNSAYHSSQPLNMQSQTNPSPSQPDYPPQTQPSEPPPAYQASPDYQPSGGKI